MRIIDKILQSEYFKERPPVLFDIGASGEINPKWKKIARYSTCVAFDADDRDFKVNEVTGSGFKRLITFNRIVTENDTPNANFYLTSSPYCSSLLKPDAEKLQPWIFKELFNIEKVAQLPGITLRQSIEQAHIDYIDWYKADTQGTDLRLFKSLPAELATSVLCTEFEPGIMDAYENEDKLYAIMKVMHQNSFWLSSMCVKGTQRISTGYAAHFGHSLVKRVIRKSPCWAEVTYLRQPLLNNQRDFLLLFIFAIIEKQYGFALEVVDGAMSKFADSIFSECKTAIFKKISGEKAKIPLVVLKRQFNKILANIND